MKGVVYMKDKIVVFILGLLLGAIISTGSIYFYTVANSSNDMGQMTRGGFQGNNGEPPEMMNSNNQMNNN